jgi:HD-GYP domain-containing protein (c-di-GMP phosphodiesterase class II)
VTDDFSTRAFLKWALKYPAADEPLLRRMGTVASVVTRGMSEFGDALNTATEVCARMSERLGLPASVQDAIASFFEQWDGKGVPGYLRGAQIPMVARIVGPTFIIASVHFAMGREAAVRVLGSQRGKFFDPQVVDAFLRLAEKEEFWAPLESGQDLAPFMLDLEPESDLTWVDGQILDDVALAFADFIDLKSPYTASHSRRVGRMCEAIAQHLGLDDAGVTACGRGGLLHDLGLVAVPSHVLDRPASALRQAEREQLRLHPYMGERIIERVPMFASFRPFVAAHHERFDGTGFHRGLRGEEIPVGARIVAVADRLDELTHAGPGIDALPLQRALEVLQSEAGTALDPDVVGVVGNALGGAPREPAQPRAWPAGLTDREVQVLRLAATGITRKDIGRRLEISENTVRHHLEHIYNKTNTATRVGAILFGIEHEIVG